MSSGTYTTRNQCDDPHEDAVGYSQLLDVSRLHLDDNGLLDSTDLNENIFCTEMEMEENWTDTWTTDAHAEEDAYRTYNEMQNLRREIVILQNCVAVLECKPINAYNEVSKCSTAYTEEEDLTMYWHIAKDFSPIYRSYLETGDHDRLFSECVPYKSSEQLIMDDEDIFLGDFHVDFGKLLQRRQRLPPMAPESDETSPASSSIQKINKPIAPSPRRYAAPAGKIQRAALDPLSIAASTLENERQEKMRWKEKATTLEKAVQFQAEQLEVEEERSKMETSYWKSEYEDRLGQSEVRAMELKKQLEESNKARVLAEQKLAKLQKDAMKAFEGEGADWDRLFTELRFIQDTCEFIKRETENLVEFAFFVHRSQRNTPSDMSPQMITSLEHNKARAAMKEALHTMRKEIGEKSAGSAGKEA
ncbi:hypothetical protein G7Z17_g11739 [Cylindrodendrum hubeiense]|uniref:Uncharacterized protein n=1 Tax=Cylindrodendrum hubeiense TaxID=595255 RepID=A0A9P5GZ02_9HYPO|nr:hypothetical protein G7Z17_g11739 [Cylindrodendrum hubeiense]